MTTTRLATEISVLVRCEQQHGLRAAPIIAQLVADDARPLPDMFPPMPQWTTFIWPAESLDFTAEWRRVDK